MYVKNWFLYLIMTRPKLTVWLRFFPVPSPLHRSSILVGFSLFPTSIKGREWDPFSSCSAEQSFMASGGSNRWARPLCFIRNDLFLGYAGVDSPGWPAADGAGLKLLEVMRNHRQEGAIRSLTPWAGSFQAQRSGSGITFPDSESLSALSGSGSRQKIGKGVSEWT
jgi:hypothetical protein